MKSKSYPSTRINSTNLLFGKNMPLGTKGIFFFTSVLKFKITGDTQQIKPQKSCLSPNLILGQTGYLGTRTHSVDLL